MSETPEFLAYVDKVFWFLLLGVAGYVATQLKELTRSVQELNIRIAVVVQSLTTAEKTLERHEERLGRLEQRRPEHD